MGNWDSYVMVEGDKEVVAFWNDSDRPTGKTLLIMGEGFDPRMNNVLKAFAEARLEFDCLSIVHDDRRNSPNTVLVTKNIEMRTQLIADHSIPFKEYKLKVGDGKDLNRGVKFMNKGIADLIAGYDNILVDISALPRVLYFNLVKNISKCPGKHNLFIVVSENAEIDKSITYRNFVEDVEPMIGFNPGIGLEAEPDRLRLLISLLGENGTDKWKIISDHFAPDEDFPVVPYPALDPFRTDNIIKEYKELFQREEAKENIIYAHERNPFELYKMLSRFIKSEDDILNKVKRKSCYGIALLSSKLLSVGALLTAMEDDMVNKDKAEVAIYNVISREYSIDVHDCNEINKKSTTFLMWIKGDAYDN